MRRIAVLYFILIGGLAAQTPTTISPAMPRYCGNGPSLWVVAPVTFGTLAIPVPLCVTLGPGITFDPVARTLSAAAAPSMQTETVTLDPATPATTTTLAYTLRKQPAPSSGILAYFHSSLVGFDTFVAAGAPVQQQLTINLPLYRPFTADDHVTVVYWAY